MDAPPPENPPDAQLIRVLLDDLLSAESHREFVRDLDDEDLRTT